VTNPRLCANSRCRSRLRRSLHAAGDLLDPPHDDLSDGEHRAQAALASEPTRAATAADELGIKAAAVRALLAVLCAAVLADQDADKPFGKWCWYTVPPGPGYVDDAIIVALALGARSPTAPAFRRWVGTPTGLITRD
jgi:hypothetical protein